MYEGFSPARAVVVNGVGEEYSWVSREFPGSRVQMHQVATMDGKPYDVLTVRFLTGAQQELYFDISSFYRPEKQTARCP